MKTINKILSVAAAAGMIAGCQVKEPMAQLPAPEEIVAPVLEKLAGDVVITAENMPTGTVTFNWSKVQLGLNTQVDYAVEASTAFGNADALALATGVTDTTLVVGYEDINQLLYNGLGLPNGVPTKVNFRVSATIGEYQPVYSNEISANFTVTAAEKVYPMVYVIGKFNEWKDDTMQHLFDFENKDVYSGMVGFFGKAAEGFKVKGTAEGWDDSCNWGLESPVEGENPASLTLISSGGSSDIKNYNKEFVHFTFDKEKLVLTNNLAFNQVGIIGLNGDWDNDIVMKFNDIKQVFYADIEATSDTKFKFRMDGDWTINYGGSMDKLEQGAGDMDIKAGTYRVYLNMNNLDCVTASLDAKAYGTEDEGFKKGGDEPVDPSEPNKGWGLVGTINNWGGTPDIHMSPAAGWYVANGVELPEGAEVKFRKDSDWDINFGGTFAADSEISVTAGGDNFAPAAGTYDIYLNPDIAKAWFVTAGGTAPAAPQTWGLVGTINNWGGDDLDWALEKGETYWVRKGVELPDGAQVKFRLANAWDDNLGGTFVVDSKITLAPGGDNMTTVAGTYDIYLDVDAKAAYFMTDGKTPDGAVIVVIDPSADSFVVGLAGSALGWDDPSFETNDRAAFTSKTITNEENLSGTYVYTLNGLTIANGDELKLRINGAWVGVGSATVEGLVTSGTDNFVAGEGGTFNLTISFVWDGEANSFSDAKMVFSK